MNIFLTGGSGFIGNALLRKLIQSGEHVHLLLRPKAAEQQLHYQNITVFKGDILDTENIEQAMQGCDRVYHLAAMAKNWSFNPYDFELVNVNGTANVLRIAGQLGIKKVVFTSTSMIFGPSNGQPVTESQSKQDFIYTDYARAKAKSEQLISEFTQNDLKIVSVYPTRLFGPGLMTEGNAATQMIKLYMQGKWRYILGNGSAYGNYAYIDDIVDGHIQAMQYGKSGSRYILGGDNLSYNDFFRQIDAITGKNHLLLHIPLPVALFFSRIELIKARLLHIYPLITPEWVRVFGQDWLFSSDLAQKEIGYIITPFEKAMRRTIEWLHLQPAWRKRR